jgi:hypothetical protein
MQYCFGGDKRDRTADLLHAMQALSQLSYTPKMCAHYNDRAYPCKAEYPVSLKDVVLYAPILPRVKRALILHLPRESGFAQ